MSTAEGWYYTFDRVCKWCGSMAREKRPIVQIRPGGPMHLLVYKYEEVETACGYRLRNHL